MADEEQVEAPPEPEEQGPREPWLTERFLALYLDLLILRLLWGAVLLALDPGAALGIAAGVLLWLAYHGGMTAQWGCTPGGRALGLRVVDLEGGPLPAPRAVLRAAVALVGLPGYLWGALPGRRTWHDMAAGSRVLALKERGRLGALVVRGAVALVALVLAGGVAYELARPEVERAQIIANARRSLDVLADLQERHKAATGGYTDDVTRLASMGRQPAEILEALPLVFLDGKVVVELEGSGYTLSARARDEQGTPVSLSRP